MSMLSLWYNPITDAAKAVFIVDLLVGVLLCKLMRHRSGALAATV
jgi:hypothetical protein